MKYFLIFSFKVIVVPLIISFGINSCEKKPDNNSSRPNILFIMSDDHATNAISAYGSRLANIAPTPNIDRLAKSGITFYNAYASATNCSPSRASMLSGKYTPEHGIFTVGDSERGNKKTISIFFISF